MASSWFLLSVITMTHGAINIKCIWISTWLILLPADKMSLVISCFCTGQRWTPWVGYGDRVTLYVGCMGSAISRCWLLKDYHRTTYRASVEYVCEDLSAPSRNKIISYRKMFSSHCTWCIYAILIAHVSRTSVWSWLFDNVFQGDKIRMDEIDRT